MERGGVGYYPDYVNLFMSMSAQPVAGKAATGVIRILGTYLACRNYPVNLSGCFTGIWLRLLLKVAKNVWRFLRKV